MKKGPIILVTLLIVTLTFILGVQYGKRVEVSDAAIQELLKRVPSPTMAPEPTIEEVEYKVLKSNSCGFSFVYPSSYEIEITSTYSAQLLDMDREQIAFSCSPNDDLDSLVDPKSSSNSATLGDAPSTLYTSDEQNNVTYTTIHPFREQTIELRLQPDIRVLIEKTFQFEE